MGWKFTTDTGEVVDAPPGTPGAFWEDDAPSAATAPPATAAPVTTPAPDAETAPERPPVSFADIYMKGQERAFNDAGYTKGDDGVWSIVGSNTATTTPTAGATATATGNDVTTPTTTTKPAPVVSDSATYNVFKANGWEVDKDGNAIDSTGKRIDVPKMEFGTARDAALRYLALGVNPDDVGAMVEENIQLPGTTKGWGKKWLEMQTTPTPGFDDFKVGGETSALKAFDENGKLKDGVLLGYNFGTLPIEMEIAGDLAINEEDGNYSEQIVGPDGQPINVVRNKATSEPKLDADGKPVLDKEGNPVMVPVLYIADHEYLKQNQAGEKPVVFKISGQGIQDMLDPSGGRLEDLRLVKDDNGVMRIIINRHPTHSGGWVGQQVAANPWLANAAQLGLSFTPLGPVGASIIGGALRSAGSGWDAGVVADNVGMGIASAAGPAIGKNVSQAVAPGAWDSIVSSNGLNAASSAADWSAGVNTLKGVTGAAGAGAGSLAGGLIGGAMSGNVDLKDIAQNAAGAAAGAGTTGYTGNAAAGAAASAAVQGKGDLGTASGAIMETMYPGMGGVASLLTQIVTRR